MSTKSEWRESENRQMQQSRGAAQSKQPRRSSQGKGMFFLSPQVKPHEASQIFEASQIREVRVMLSMLRTRVRTSPPPISLPPGPDPPLALPSPVQKRPLLSSPLFHLPSIFSQPPCCPLQNVLAGVRFVSDLLDLALANFGVRFGVRPAGQPTPLCGEVTAAIPYSTCVTLGVSIRRAASAQQQNRIVLTCQVQKVRHHWSGILEVDCAQPF